MNSRGEPKVLYKARTHPKILFPAIVIQIVLLALHLLVGKYLHFDRVWVLHLVILALEVWYVVIPIAKWYNEIYTITSISVKRDWGVLYKHSREIKHAMISSISEERGILDRIFGCATINFYDAAADAQPKTSGKWNIRGVPKQTAGVKFHDVGDWTKVRKIARRAQAAACS